MLAAAEPSTIRERQQAVDELRPRLDLRLEMAIAGAEAGTGSQQEALEAWAVTAAAGLPRRVFYIALLATALSSAGLALWIFSGSGPIPFVAAGVLQSIFALSVRGRVAPVLAAAESIGKAF